METYYDNPDIRALQSRLEHTDPGVRRVALIELADLEDPDALPLLAAALNRDEDAEVRTEAARLLEAWEEPTIVTALCDALSDGNESVRDAAAQSLNQLKSAAAGRAILPYVQHPYALVRSRALRALRELRLPEAADAALAALNDENPPVRREAVSVLGWLKFTPALPHLARLAVEDPQEDVRRTAVGTLVMAEDETATAALLQALRDDAWQVREEAMMALGKLRLAQAAEPLVRALQDEYWQCRLQAARSLGKLRITAAVAELAGLLQHSISNLRKEAALALGEIGSPAGLPALQKAEQDPDPEVRKSVRIALAQLSLLHHESPSAT